MRNCHSCLMPCVDQNLFGKKCIYCITFKKILKEKPLLKNLKNLKTAIKKSQKNNDYDCIVGLSGGTDSSYALLKAVEIGLKPLAVHFDNGWNSSIAAQNIYNLVNFCKVDLICHVADWHEFREFQRAFFHAHVIDIELLTDNVLYSVNYFYAKKYNLKYILAGFNKKTEGIMFPKNWNWWKYDKKNILSIGKAFNVSPPKSFPLMSTWDLIKYEKYYNITMVPFLDYFNYNKNNAARDMNIMFKFVSPKEKHTESTFTKIYQQEILPKKFKVDKRIPHFAALILTNQMSKKNAQKKLKNLPIIPKYEKTYLLKKLQLSAAFYNNYLKSPQKSHKKYNNELLLKNILRLFYRIYKKFTAHTTIT